MAEFARSTAERQPNLERSEGRSQRVSINHVAPLGLKRFHHAFAFTPTLKPVSCPLAICKSSRSRLLWPILCLLASRFARRGQKSLAFLRDNQGMALSGSPLMPASFPFRNGFTQPFTTTDASGHFRFVDNAGWWTVSVPASELNRRRLFLAWQTQT